MTSDIKCLKWNESNFKLCNDFNLTKYTLALNPSCWLNLKTKGNPIKVSYLGQTNRLASLDNLNNIFVYDWCKADIKTVKSKYVYNCKLTNLTSNSKGNQIATCADNGKIQLWNFKFSNCKMLTEFRGHYQSIRNVEYSNDSNYLVTCSNDKTFKIWDCQSNKFMASNMFHRNWVNMAKFFKGNNLIASCSRDSYIQVFDCCSGKLLPSIILAQVYDTNEGRFVYSIDHFNGIKSMDISSDDKLLATTSFRFDDEITLWKTKPWHFNVKMHSEFY